MVATPELITRYFATDRLIIMADAGTGLGDIAASISEALASLEQPFDYEIDDKSAELPVFEIPGADPVRFVPVELEGGLSEARVMSAVNALNNDVSGIVAAAPNWLVTPCPPEQGVFGGPGTRPRPEPNPNPYFKFHFYPRHIDYKEIEDGNAGAGVTVYVLDTAPDPADWNTVTQPSALVSTLKPKLDIVILPSVQDQFGREHLYRFNAPGHIYQMQSHGIFAAGIIHSIAPQAHIKLVRVLNQYGVGTLGTVLDGLLWVHSQVASAGSSARAIVNMSLTVAYPDAAHLPAFSDAPWFASMPGFADALNAEHEAHEAELIARRGQTDWGDPPALRRPTTLPQKQRFALEVICRSLRWGGVGLIASAGNEREPGNPAPPTLHPAAYDEVVGVGALASLNDKTMSAVTQVATTAYSCRADKPPSEGFLVMGGDTQGDVASATDGIVGIWIDSQMPDPNANARVATSPGWARWAGTSFAAPIITGALAALMRDKLKTFNEALHTLHDGWTETSDPQSLAEVPQVVLVQQKERVKETEVSSE